SAVNGVRRNNLARIHADGSLDAWDPSAIGEVHALLQVGSTLYVGGEFNSIGGASRNNLAAVDATTGVPTSWAPDPDGPVHCLAGVGTSLFAGGGFTHASGQVRNDIAGFTTTTGALTAWDANVDG